MLEIFEATLQAFLTVQIDTFNKVIETMTATFTNTIQKFYLPTVSDTISDTLKRENKKKRHTLCCGQYMDCISCCFKILL